MSYLVFVLGLLLSLCGAYFIYFGYGIIAVERGWASVIAGATALSSGVVTIALAFILRGLAQLRAALAAGKSTKPLSRESAPRRVAVQPRAIGRIDKLEPAVPAKAAPAPEAPAATAQLRAEDSRAEDAWAEDARAEDVRAEDVESRRPKDFLAASVEPPRAVRERAGIVPTRRMPERPNVPRASIDDVRRLVGDQLKRTPQADSGAEGAREIDEGAPANALEAWPETSYESDVPSGDRGAPPAPSGSAMATEPQGVDVASPHVDDWADQGHERETAPSPIAARDEREERRAGAQWPSGEASEAAFHASRPPDAGLESPASPPQGEERGAIVGRYESAGTSYVMYADGSIDAQSERGAFRFNSMAELKAFLDAQG